MKLISMTDFVLLQQITKAFGLSQIGWYEAETIKLDKIRNYANFLKYPLHISMFIPCDFEGTPLQEPFFNENATHYRSMSDTYEEDKAEHIAYQKAKENVFFEGFVSWSGIIKNVDTGELYTYEEIIQSGTIENWVGNKLTESAIKLIGL